MFFGDIKTGDHVIYRGKTYTFPGEVVALTANRQVVIKAFGDIAGNYAGMMQVFSPALLEPYDFALGSGTPFLVIDPERDVIAQVRTHLNSHAVSDGYKELLGFAQLSAVIALIDKLEPDGEPPIAEGRQLGPDFNGVTHAVKEQFSCEPVPKCKGRPPGMGHFFAHRTSWERGSFVERCIYCDELKP